MTILKEYTDCDSVGINEYPDCYHPYWVPGLWPTLLRTRTVTTPTDYPDCGHNYRVPGLWPSLLSTQTATTPYWVPGLWPSLPNHNPNRLKSHKGQAVKRLNRIIPAAMKLNFNYKSSFSGTCILKQGTTAGGIVE